MARKAIMPATIKADEPGQGAGEFEALVAVFGNVDLQGDRIMKGAFGKSLEQWASSGDPIPVIWSHRWEDPDYHVGEVLEAKELDEGLWVRAQLDLEIPKAPSTYRLLKGRRVKQFSFAYDVGDEREAEGDERVNELLELSLIEVGPTLLGANPDTQLLIVKSADEARTVLERIDTALVKAGRVLSGANEGLLREAHERITRVLGQLDRQAPDDDDDGKGGDAGGVKMPDPLSLRTLIALEEAEAAIA